jgi:hypothetical protein
MLRGILKAVTFMYAPTILTNCTLDGQGFSGENVLAYYATTLVTKMNLL